jgi:hypothetical protein
LIITALMALGGAGIAEAAGGGSATMTVTPTKASSPSSLTVAVTGLSGFSGLPSSVTLLLPGFTSSAKALPVLCTASQSSANNCPAASEIGTGSVGISLFGSPTTVPLKLYLGDPLQTGDIASVILSGSLAGSSLAVSGRLFVPAEGGGIELLLSGFPSGLPVTLTSLSITAEGHQNVTTTVKKKVTTVSFTGKGKHKRKHTKHHTVTTKTTATYSVITNPSSCTGMWTGTATFTYPMGENALPLSAACTP